MTGHDDIRTDREVDAAIVHVLEAEAAAREAVAAANARASGLIDAARAAAQAVAATAERRIRRVRDAFEERTRAAVTAIDASSPAPAAGHGLCSDDLEHLDTAIAALVARLTRGTP